MSGMEREESTQTEPGDGFTIDVAPPRRLERTDEQAFGRYRLVYQIAFGGMATVYLGRALGPAGFDRPVAIKRIHPHLAAQRRFVAMFLDEARILSRISHPNVCTVHDFGEIDGTYYMAMEYLVGEPMSALIQAVAKDPGRLRSTRWAAFAVRLAADACEGLHAAHELRDEHGELRNVVHRDVTPHNLVVTYDGALKVLDFGVAFAEGRLHHSTTGSMKGKLAYMPPEQLAGAPADRRFDVWALGVCLFEMLAGARLFRRDNEVDTMVAVREHRIPRPTEGRWPEVDGIVARALARDPDARYPTARALGHDLQAALARSGERVGLADLAEWMAPLFTQSRERREALLDVVHASASVEGVPPIVVAAGDAAPIPPSPQTASLPALPGAMVPSPETATLPALARHAPPAAAPRRRRWLGALAVLPILLVAALAVVALRDPTPAPAVRLPRASSEEPPAEPVRRVAPPAAEPPAEPPAGPSAERAAEPEPLGEPARAHRRRPRPVTGTVNLVTSGAWADVYLGARPLGRTPRRLVLPAGRHVLRVLPLGRPPERRVTVDVPPHESVRVVVPLR